MISSRLKTNLLAVAGAAGSVLGIAQRLTSKLDPLRRLPIVGGTISDLMDLVDMLNDYFGGSYRKPPVTVLAAALGIFAYAVSPLDIIPDELPIIGAIDDLFVAKLLLDLCISHELDRYRLWREESAQAENDE